MFKTVHYSLKLYFLLLIIPVHSAASKIKPNYYTTALDVSRYQGEVNWARLKEVGITHVILQSTRGEAFQDPDFLKNWKRANDQGIRTDVYHFFISSHSPSEEQVKNIMKVFSQINYDTDAHVFAVDVEQHYNENALPDEVANNLYAFLNDLEAHDFQNIFIYTSYHYWENKVSWKLHDFSKYPLWLAQYTDKEENLKVPTTWKDVGWTFWQYTDKGRIDGIGGHVDMNYCKPYSFSAASPGSMTTKHNSRKYVCIFIQIATVFTLLVI